MDWLSAGTEPEALDPGARDGYAAFRTWAYERYGRDPLGLNRRLHDRYFGRNPDHDPFVTPGLVRACTLTGPLEEVAERLREIERAGVTDVTVMGSLDRPWVDDDVLADVVALAELTA